MNKEDENKCEDYIYGIILVGMLMFFVYYQWYSSIIIEQCTLFCVILNTVFGFIYGGIAGFIYGLKYRMKEKEE